MMFGGIAKVLAFFTIIVCNIALAHEGEDHSKMPMRERVATRASRAIKLDRIIGHLENLNSVAVPTTVEEGDSTTTTRATGTLGYDRTVNYVKRKLESRDYEVMIQPFEYDTFEYDAETTFLTVDGMDFFISDEEPANITVSIYSAPSDGVVTGELAFVTPDFNFDSSDYDDTDGCQASDFDGVDVAGKVAVIQRGGCFFFDKAQNAVNAGAVAVIIFNQGNSESRLEVVQARLSKPGEVSGSLIPCFGASFFVAKEWYDSIQGGDVIMASLNIDATTTVFNTVNVIAETSGGDPNNVVMVGARLDSPANSPGINNNGSGVAALLEFAMMIERKIKSFGIDPKNKLRFGFWGGEEGNYFGASHYTDELFGRVYDEALVQFMEENGLDDPASLTDEQYDMVYELFLEINPVKMYINLDIIGSPNHIYGVYDGDLSDSNDPDQYFIGQFLPPKGLGQIESALLDFFENKANVPTTPSIIYESSEHAAFLGWDVPIGGLYTGLDLNKTEEEAEIFGGQANAPYDPCYAQTCDTLDNVNPDVVTMNARATAYAATFFAMSDPVLEMEEEEDMNRRRLKKQQLPRKGKTTAAAHKNEKGDVM